MEDGGLGRTHHTPKHDKMERVAVCVSACIYSRCSCLLKSLLDFVKLCCLDFWINRDIQSLAISAELYTGNVSCCSRVGNDRKMISRSFGVDKINATNQRRHPAPADEKQHRPSPSTRFFSLRPSVGSFLWLQLWYILPLPPVLSLRAVPAAASIRQGL